MMDGDDWKECDEVTLYFNIHTLYIKEELEDGRVWWSEYEVPDKILKKIWKLLDLEKLHKYKSDFG